MSVEDHLKESVLRTALQRLFLRDWKKSPRRAVRNIRELLVRLCAKDADSLPTESELSQALKDRHPDEFINWVIHRLFP